jgi:RNA polymerase sigma-70 factor (ECF subfamily)
MSDEVVNTVQLNGWVDRMCAGDLAARDELLRAVGNRLERLARKMLRRFPDVQRWAQTGDVLQNSLMRLLRALEQVRPDSVREFFGLAAEQMRRELLDLARHFHGPQGQAAHHHSGVLDASHVGGEEAPDDLERWSAFHDKVAGLPAEERVVVDLIYYHGWGQAAVAEMLEVSVRTVQRRWETALSRLHQAIGRSQA